MKKPPRSPLCRLFPFLTWIGELRNPQTLRADIIAGITVALVLIPQAMAYAQLAGLPSYYGLYTAFLPPLVAALWGSSRQLSTGPVAMVALLTGAALAPLAAQGVDIIPVAIMLSLFAGLIQLTMGILRWGAMFSFVSHPVLLGLTNAAALIIASSQLDKFLGVDVEKASLHLVTVWRVLLAASEHIYWPALAMGSGALAVMIICRRINRQLPAVLIAVGLCAVIAWATNYDQHSLSTMAAPADTSANLESFDGDAESSTEHLSGRVVGAVPQGLPAVSLPAIDWALLAQLWGPLLVIALIGFAEPLAISKTMALQTRHRHDANQELIGQGLAKIAGGLTQSFPCSGSYSRSAVNLMSGAKTGFSSAVTSAAVVVCLIWLTPLLWHIPEATLAAVIFMAVSSLIKIRPFIEAWRVSHSDSIIAVVTFTTTLVAAPHLEIGILLGVALSIVIYLWKTAHPHLAVVARHWDGSLKDAEKNHLRTSDQILALRLDARLYFANTSHFEDTVSELVLAQPKAQVVILFAQGINSIDSTGEAAISRLSEGLDKQSVTLLICGAKQKLRTALHQSGWIRRFGAERLIATESEAIEYAHRLMANAHRDQCPLIHHKPLPDHAHAGP